MGQAKGQGPIDPDREIDIWPHDEASSATMELPGRASEGKLDRLRFLLEWGLCDADQPMPPNSPSPAPPRLAGFELLNLIGHGGTGLVYRARQLSLGWVVALKLLREEAHLHESSTGRFRSEAEVMARLSHPNIVQVLDLIEDAGKLYLSMEWMKGGSLAGKLDGTPWPPRQAAKIVEVLSLAVQAAHDAGIVHRDLKPGNVLLDEDGTPKLADFGLAKLLDETVGPTMTGDLIGTPSYMAPEQALGRAGAVGPAVDVYGLGAILYELLTGRPPHKGSNRLETLSQLQSDEIVAPRCLQSKIPTSLETICLTALAREPRRRYATAGALADDLGRYLSNQPIRARPPGPFRSLVAWSRRRPASAIALFGGVGICIGLAVLAVEWNRRIHRLRAEELVSSLDHTETEGLLDWLNRAEAHRAWVKPLLAQTLSAASRGSTVRLNAALVSDAGEPAKIDILVDELMTSDLSPSSIDAVCEALGSKAATPLDLLWNAASNGRSAMEGQRLRCAAALARLDPDSERWKTLAPQVSEVLVRMSPTNAAGWFDSFRPARAWLIDSLCQLAMDSEDEIARLQAADLATTYGQERVDSLVRVAVAAEPRVFSILCPAIAKQPSLVVSLIEAELAQPKPVGRGKQFEEATETWAKRQAGALILLIRVGFPDRAWPLLRLSADPSLRTHLIHLMARLEVDPQLLIDRLRVEPDASTRYALLIAIGQYEAGKVDTTELARLIGELLAAYRTDPDPGVHSAIDWVMRRWGRADDIAAVDLSLRGQPRGDRRWFVDRFGTTFAVIQGPVRFNAGSRPDEPKAATNESWGPEIIRRTFAIATKELTLQQFRDFLSLLPPEEPYSGERTAYMPDPACPALSVSFLQAMAYCRWRSERAGFDNNETAYPRMPSAKARQDLPIDFLNRGGYRLPSEAEWEYVARAGSEGYRPFGYGMRWLGAYAHFRDNTDDESKPVGTAEPNDLGLFDILGNAWELCHRHDLDDALADVRSDEFSPLSIVDPALDQIARGGCFMSKPSMVRSAVRHPIPAGMIDESVGFRLAMTLNEEISSRPLESPEHATPRDIP